MVRIEDKLGEIVKGTIKIEIEDKQTPDEMIEFELKPTEGDKSDIFYNYKKLSELSSRYEEAVKRNTLTPEFIEIHDKKSRELMEYQNIVAKRMLERSYPAFVKEQISSILVMYGNEILIELYMFWGLVNKKAYEALKKKQEEELKKLSGDVATPGTNPPKNEH